MLLPKSPFFHVAPRLPLQWGANNPLRIVLCCVQRMMRVFFARNLLYYYNTEPPEMQA